MKKQLFLSGLALSFITVLACCMVFSTEEPESPAPHDDPPSPSMESAQAKYIKLTPQEARDMMSDDAIILDVRTPKEYDEGHIANSVLLPDYEIKDMVETVIADKNHTVIVYCRSGARSKNAAEYMIEMGYTTVFDIGGITDWEGEIVRNP